MKKNRLGRTELLVSNYCLGTMTWGSQTGTRRAHAQIDAALAGEVPLRPEHRRGL